MYNPFSLEGKTILVTGASSGIGRTTAIECSKLGATVIITARNVDNLKDTLSMLEGDGHQLICSDLENINDIEKLAFNVPYLDGLVSNAGMDKLAPISLINTITLDKIFRVNSIAPVILIKAMLKEKKIRKKSSIVFTSSISGNYTSAIAHASYSMSKSALSSYMKIAALELAVKQIRCNAVCPGMTETKLIHATLSEEQLNKDRHNNYPLGRYGSTKDVAHGIIYLLSDAASWVTGTNLIIDGGYTLR